MRQFSLSWVLGVAAAFAAAQRPASASECRLSVTATDSVLFPRQSAQVNVLAHFPATAYAFAASEFDVAADTPGWSSASDGLIAGANVFAAEAGQAHNPFIGEFADPSNPLRIWSGVFTPDSDEPKLFKVEATPSTFSYYPSELTGSAVECEAASGNKWLLINPLSIGEALIAPGAKTEVMGGYGDDLLIGGQTSFDGDELDIEFGLFAPQGRSIRMIPDMPPTGLTLEIEVAEDPYKMFKFTVNIPPDPAGETYNLHADWPSADAYEYRLTSFAGQTVRLRIAATNNRGMVLHVDGLPGAYSTRAFLDRRANETHVLSRFEYDDAVRVTLPDGAVIDAVSIEVHAIKMDLMPVGIGMHAVSATGTGGMMVGLGDGSVRFVSSGVLN